MSNNFINGGQIFLHRFRMLKQVAGSTLQLSILVGIIGAILLLRIQIYEIDFKASISYIKANLAITINSIMPRYSKQPNISTIDAYTDKGLYKQNVSAELIIKSDYFANEYQKLFQIILKTIKLLCGLSLFTAFITYILWHKFGKITQADKQIKGGKIYSSLEVAKTLYSTNRDSDFMVGKMPLVRDSETKHFLVTGSTGSGKTNLIHNILFQVKAKNQSAIILDQTGEMIAKYYDASRGDIVFNPFDLRGKNWDFWADCREKTDLERFTNILFSFNRRKHNYSSDIFWEKSAEVVFTSCVEYLKDSNNNSLKALYSLTNSVSLKQLAAKLDKYDAKRYLSQNNEVTGNSILSVLATTVRPLSYLSEEVDSNKFSLKEYFQQIKVGGRGWLFLATKPSNRELTMVLNACLLELAFVNLMEIGIDQDRKMWFVMDELSSLGKLPSLSTIMTEGRKYGACILAGLQSLNQLYSNYGQYDGSTIFGQFGTMFFFHNKEVLIGKMISEICGTETMTKQQKNTSFGANSYRDGQSYTELEKSKYLIEYSDLVKLGTGECYVILPSADIRLAKIAVPLHTIEDTSEGFIQKESQESNSNSNDDKLNIQKEENLLSIIEEIERKEMLAKKYPKKKKSVKYYIQ
jgi:type IV conjugative transfer system coupling protein TraD